MAKKVEELPTELKMLVAMNRMEASGERWVLFIDDKCPPVIGSGVKDFNDASGIVHRAADREGRR